MTEEDRAILAFEETQHMDQAHYDEAVRQRFGLSYAPHAQRLNELMRGRDVLEAFPVFLSRRLPMLSSSTGRDA